LVKEGTQLLRGVSVEITRLETPYPLISDKDSRDLGPKLRYIADLLEQLRNALKSIGVDSLNFNLKSTEIMLPVDLQGTVIMLPVDLQGITPEVLNTLKWGRNSQPAWVYGSEVTAPVAGTALVSRTVSSGKKGYVHGFFISAGEANDFKLNWTSGGTERSIRIPFSGRGAVYYADFVALNEGLPADAGTNITITNVNDGSANTIYQAMLLYMEV